MKKILLFLIIFPFSIHSQSLSGKYCLELKGKISSTCIEFFKKNEFKYSYPRSGHSQDNGFGLGHYTIKNNKLVLNFNLTKFKSLDHSVIEKQGDNIQDSVTIRVEVFDVLEQKTLPYANIFILPENKDIPNSNKNGIVSFKLKKDSYVKKEISCSYLGYYEYKTSIIPNADHNIKIYLDRFKGKIIKDEIWNYQIKKLNDKFLVIQNFEAKKQVWRKIKENSLSARSNN